MDDDDDEIDKLNVLKQIGKGSFSNVYLCQSSQLGSLQLEDIPMYYVIKEININALVRKYVTNNSKKRKAIVNQQKQHTWEVNITPYQGNLIIEDVQKQVSEDEYYFKRLKELVESEVEALYLLDHENIIKLYGSKFCKGVYFLNMEYCDLGDVYQRIKANPKNNMTNKFMFDFLIQTSNGLHYIHKKQIIHRDIKLHNILMQKDDDKFIFKISDFGFACYDLSDESILDGKDILASKYFKLCGTPFYMAPEIILNMSMLENFTKYSQSVGNSQCPTTDSAESLGNSKKIFYSKSIDIWSYGVCVFELIYDSLPFPTIRNIMELENFFKSTDAQVYINNRIDEHNRLHPTLRKLLYMMLQVDPLKRATSSQIIQCLDDEEKLKDDLIFTPTGGITPTNLNTSVESTLKKHIVENPPDNEKVENLISMLETMTLSDSSSSSSNCSWEHIGSEFGRGENSLMMKVSVERGFLDWLMNKK